MGHAGPRIRTSLYLVIPSGSTKCFETLNFGFNVVGLKVEMHTFFRRLLVVGLLEEYSYLRVWETESTIDMATLFRQRFFDGIECSGPE